MDFEVIIIGGSCAGLSTAMTLGRSLRRTLIIDDGKPCNRFTPHSHNFLTQDGKTPEEIATIAREQVSRYPSIGFHNDLAESIGKTESGFEVTCQSGLSFRSQKLVFATGIKDLLPEIPGFLSCWGKTIIHCPYCHGYEFKGKKTGIMATGDMALHLAPLVKNLSDDIMLLTNGKADFDTEQFKLFERQRIKIIDKEISEFQHEHGTLKNVVFSDHSSLSLDAMYARIDFVQSTDLPESLGCELTEPGYIKTDEFSQTTIEGVYACGDNSSSLRSIANAVASGQFTGAKLNMDFANALFHSS